MITHPNQSAKYIPVIASPQGEAISNSLLRDCFVAKNAPRNDEKFLFLMLMYTDCILHTLRL